MFPTASKHGARSLKTSAASSAFSTAASTGRADGTSDDYFFVAYNMHWEPHEFDLPKLPKGMQWTLCINTDDAENNGICPPESLEVGQEPQEELRQYMVPPRSILVFRGFKPISGPASERMAKAGKW